MVVGTVKRGSRSSKQPRGGGGEGQFARNLDRKCIFTEGAAYAESLKINWERWSLQIADTSGWSLLSDLKTWRMTRKPRQLSVIMTWRKLLRRCDVLIRMERKLNTTQFAMSTPLSATCLSFKNCSGYIVREQTIKAETGTRSSIGKCPAKVGTVEMRTSSCKVVSFKKRTINCGRKDQADSFELE